MCSFGFLTGLLLLLCHLQNAVPNANRSEKHRKRIFLNGDILLAGLSPVHYPPREEDQSKIDAFSAECGGVFNIRGLQHAEAILFAVEKINANDSLLPGVTLGVDIRDTCNSVDYAISEALHFQFIQEAYHREDNKDVCIQTEDQDMETVAVVGAAYSGVSMAIASLSGLFYVPTVSYASSTRLLSDRVRFKYFLRTIPSDTLQVEAMLGVIAQFGWNFVSTVASDTEYGRSGMDAFKSAAQARYSRICIAEDALFTSRTPKADVRQIIARIRHHPRAKVIVLFAELNDALYFVETAKEENLTDYVWLGSDAFAQSHRVLSGNLHVLKYWLATAPQSQPYQPFREYFRNITEVRVARNPWLQQYENEVRLQLNESSGPFEYSPYSSTAIDAVYAVAHGLHSMYGCTERKCRITRDTTDLYSFIQNASFVSPTGHQVQFDASGSSGSYYSVYYVDQTALDKFSVLGQWHRNGGFQFSEDYVNSDRSLDKLQFLATCSSTCSPGSRKESQKLFPECCWECHPCPANSVSNASNLTSCTPCREGFKANEQQSACLVIKPTIILHSTEGVAIVCACGVGVMAVFATFVIFSRYRDSAVVKASSRDMSYILLIGLAWCFALPVLWLVQPTPLLCQVFPFLVGSGIALVIGPLLTKTNRIARIFSLNMMRTGRAPFLSNKWQMAFTAVCFLIENSLSATWILVSPSKPERIPNGNEEVSIECRDGSLVGLAIWATFNAGLFLLCTYQAFLVRKVPENYNEAKFIAFTMVTISISAFVCVPTYFGTHGRYKKILTCFLVILCSAVSLVCLFGPKLYIIILRPAKNRPLQPRLDPTTAEPSYCSSMPSPTSATSQMSLRGSTSCICEQPPLRE